MLPALVQALPIILLALLGLALLVAALAIEGPPLARWVTAMAALALVALSLPRGTVRERYAGWTPRIV